MAKAKPAETPAVEILEPEIPVNKSSRNKKAIEKHTVTTEWKEVKRIDAPQSKARKTAPVVEIEDDDAEDDGSDLELPDDVRAVLSEYDSASGLVMEINRLPNYHLNGKQDPASMQFCGDRDFDPQEYKNILRLYYAKEGVPNFFILKLKTSDRQWIPGGRIGPINVEAATPEEKARHGIFIPLTPEPAPSAVTVTHAMPMQSAAVQPPQSVTERINEVAQIFSVFKEMGLIPKQQNPVPVQPAQPELTEEAILLKAAMASNEAKEKIANGIGKLVFGGASEAVDDKEPYWFQPAFSLFSNILQGITPGLNALLQVTAQAKQVQLQQVQQPVISPPEGLAAIPAPMPEAVPQAVEPLPPTAPTMMDLYAIAFNAVLEVRKLPAPLNLPRKAARALLDLADNNSIETPNGPVSPFDSVIADFLETEPEQLLTLAETFAPESVETIKAPDAVEWVKAVQDELRKEWNGSDQDQQP